MRGSLQGSRVVCKVLAGGALAAIAGASYGQTLTWVGPLAGGEWDDPTNWSPLGVPDSMAESALIAQPGTSLSVVELEVGSLTIGDSTVSLDMRFNSGLWGPMSNAGTVTVTPGARLNVFDASTFSGSGTLRLDGPVIAEFQNSNIAFLQIQPGATLLNEAGHTIAGSGVVDGTFVNRGVLLADLPDGLLRFESGSITNEGELRVAPGSTLEIGTVLVDNTAGSIVVDGGTLRSRWREHAVIHGGRIETLNGGTIEFENDSTTSFVAGVVLEGTVDQAANTVAIIDNGGIVNNGTYILRAHADLRPGPDDGGPSDSILAGTGELRVAGPPNLLRVRGGGRLINEAGHTIRGSGRLERIVNRGNVIADLGAGLRWEVTSDEPNSGLLASSGNGALQIWTSITQTASGRIENLGGTVTIQQNYNPTIIGGTLAGTAAPISVSRNSSLTLQDITIEGVLATPFGDAEVRVVDDETRGVAGFTNNGTINLFNPGWDVTSLRFYDSGTIDGTGTVLLGYANENYQSRIKVNTPLTIEGTFGPGQTIAGRGLLEGNLNLNGTLSPGTSGGDATQELTMFDTITFGDSHTFVVDLDGYDAAGIDRLTGTGDVTLDGTLQIRVAPGFVVPPWFTFEFISVGSVSGRFDSIVAPTPPPGLSWIVRYSPDSVAIRAVAPCAADVTTDGTSNGIPDGVATLSDFSYYLGLWGAGDTAADLTSDGTSSGIPDGAVTLSDFSFYLALWGAGCP